MKCSTSAKDLSLLLVRTLKTSEDLHCGCTTARARPVSRHRIEMDLSLLASRARIRLSKDGVRVSQPQKLPEALLGKALFPHAA